MGTNVAVSVADLSLGYLEIQAQLLPPVWYRYIDDGLFKTAKTEEKISHPKTKNSALSEAQIKMLKILNNLDPKIFWTTEKIKENCEFLDLAINPTEKENVHSVRSFFRYVFFFVENRKFKTTS